MNNPYNNSYPDPDFRKIDQTEHELFYSNRNMADDESFMTEEELATLLAANLFMNDPLF